MPAGGGGGRLAIDVTAWRVVSAEPVSLVALGEHRQGERAKDWFRRSRASRSLGLSMKHLFAAPVVFVAPVMRADGADSLPHVNRPLNP